MKKLLSVLSFLILFLPQALAADAPIPDPPLPPPPPAPSPWSIQAQVTEYSSTPGQTDDTPDITASGTHVHNGTAACPPTLSFGTRISIDGKHYTCEDRMAARFPHRFDMWVETRGEALQWGVRKVEVTVIPSSYIAQ